MAEARAEARRAAVRRDLEAMMGVLPSLLAVRGTDRGLEITLGGTAFDVGSDAPTSPARVEVERIAARLRPEPELRLLVEGHTDATGSARLNLELSRLRAEGVRAALVRAGLDPAQISVVGTGQESPIADNGTPAGRARNRRVEIVPLGF